MSCCTAGMPLRRDGIPSPGRSNDDAQLEDKSANRLADDRRVGDDVGGVPPASGLRVRHLRLRGVYLHGLHGLLRFRGRLRHGRRGYYGGGYGGYPGGYGYGSGGYGSGGYDFGRPGYNPGGLGGPASGLGVRPGLGVGGFGPGR
jgi:hypothetical protein